MIFQIGGEEVAGFGLWIVENIVTGYAMRVKKYSYGLTGII